MYSILTQSIYVHKSLIYIVLFNNYMLLDYNFNITYSHIPCLGLIGEHT